MKPKAFVSWSSGKDSAFALYEAKRQELAEIVGILITLNGTYDRVAMHGTRHSLLDKQIVALDLPAVKVFIPDGCSNELYEARMAEACNAIKAQDVTHIIFGDLFLRDVRAYREEKLANAGMVGLFPLWQRDTAELGRQIIESGFVAHLVCIDAKRMDRSFAGRRFDVSLLKDLPTDIDPCGENGEFHTVVTGGPIFSQPIFVENGAVVERDGFVFADVIPIG